MTGPKIIAEPQDAPLVLEDMSLNEIDAFRATGIRRTNTGGWAAVKQGRLVEEFHGLGSKRAAIQAAGTNAVIA